MPMIEKYRLAFEISPVPLLLVSNVGEIILANARLDELFEYDSGELIGQSVEVLVPDTVRRHHPELRNAYYRVPTKRNMGEGRDLHGVTKSGAIIPLELGLEPVIDEETSMALVAAIDIRQRKNHEELMLRAMDAAASAMVMVNEKGIVVFNNKAATAMFGYNESELLGKPVEILVPEEFRRPHPVYIGSFMSASKARSMGLGRDLFARHRDGSKIPVEIALTPVESVNEKLVMSTIVDLSERVAAAQVDAKKSEELAMLNDELSHFAYSASHDLKAPLSSIMGLLNICIEDLHDNNIEEVQNNLTKILQISRRSAEKVEGILKIARAGRDPLQVTPIDLNQTVNEIWTDVAGASEKQIELVLELQHQDPVITEHATLKVILENLLSNAIRYRDAEKPRSFVRLTSDTTGESLQIVVSDNGIGIPSQNQEQVFVMFKRLDERSGDGLGLALVRKQIERMGGSICVTSIEGEGAEFTFTLPIQQENS